jgi:hypothetical protein
VFCGAAALAGCSFTGLGPSDAPVDSVSIIADAGADAAGVIGWSLHTKTDFDDLGADPTMPPSFVTSLASTRDLLEPAAYQLGGLLGRASNTQLFNSKDAPWDAVAWAAAPSTTAQSSIDLPLGDYGTRFPTGLGIDSGESFCTWWEGEIYLEAGSHNFSLDVDSSGFVEIDLPDGTFRVGDDVATLSATVGITIDDGLTGYFPIRIAHSEGTGPSRLNFLHQPPAVVALSTLEHARLRARASELTGAVRNGFDDLLLGDPVGVTRFEDTLIGEDYGGGFPPEVGITDHDTWSQRLAGQVWIDVAGGYAMHVISDAGYRVTFDGVVVGDPARFDDGQHDDTIDLGTAVSRGWHDLAVDHQDDTGNTDLDIALIDPAQAPDKIAVTELRPLSTGRERIVSDAAPVGYDPLPGQMFVRLAAGRLTEVVELAVTYQIDHPAWQELELTLVTPWGEPVVIRTGVAQPGNAEQTVTQLVPAAMIPVNPGNDTRPATGRWQLDVDDIVGGDAGALIRWSITARYTGGPPAIAPTAQYTSGVHDFGSPRQVSGLTASASTPIGSAAAIALRTCTALPCTGEFVPATAMTFPLPAAQYVQIQVAFTSEGIESPFVDDVDVYVLP